MKSMFLIPEIETKYRYSTAGAKPTTYILGARCKDGVVIVGDRKILGGSEPYKEKIKQLPIYKSIIFAAAGWTQVFEEFLQELPRRVTKSIDLNIEEKKKHATFHYEYGNFNFRADCIELLKEIKQRYSEVAGPKPGQTPFIDVLQVLFVQKEFREDETPFSQLYYADLLNCTPFAQDGQCVIGQGYVGTTFLKKWDSTFSMRDTARFGAFIIKYAEKEKLSFGDGVGVGDFQPQVWVYGDKDKEPREMVGNELDGLLNGIDEEVEKKRREIGSLSDFLRKGG